MFSAPALSALLFALAVPTAQGQPAARSALVCLLEGKATATEPSRQERNLSLFDWLPAGTTVSTSEGARLVLVFSNGQRWEILGKGKTVVEETGLAPREGQARKLAPVSMIASMSQVRVKAAEGQVGAFTVRGGVEADVFIGLVPAEGDTVLADEADLRFQPPSQAARFRVEIEDDLGNSIFSVETQKPEVHVSPGILKPGSLYFWRVRTLEGPKPAVSAETSFMTVQEKFAKIRAQLQAEVDKNHDPALRSLLSEMDRWLGLKRTSSME